MSEQLFSLDIVTPEGVFLKTLASMVEFPSEAGDLGIYYGHVPILADVSAGELRVHHQGKIDRFAIAGGFAQVRPSSVRILATFASECGDESEIEKACQRAKTMLEAAEAAPSSVDSDLRALRTEMALLARTKGAQKRRSI